jgi:hypothetical protein
VLPVALVLSPVAATLFPVAVLEELVAVESVWLMLMSWSSEFREIICPTIAVESTGAVGSWFCNSLTSKLRNVELVLEPPRAELELVEEVVELVAFAVALFVVDWAVLTIDARLIGDVDMLPP